MFFRVLPIIFLSTYSHWERPFGESFLKIFLPSRGRSREREKYKVFRKIFFLSSGRARNRRFYEWF